MLLFITPKVCISIVFSFSWAHFNSQEKLKTMRIQNFGVTNKEDYGMLWYFLEWSILTDNLVPRLLSSPRNEVAKATTTLAGEARTLQVVSFSSVIVERADYMSAPENCHATRKARSGWKTFSFTLCVSPFSRSLDFARSSQSDKSFDDEIGKLKKFSLLVLQVKQRKIFSNGRLAKRCEDCSHQKTPCTWGLSMAADFRIEL